YDGNGFFAKGDNGIFDEVLGEKFMQAFLSADTEEDIEKIIGRFKMKLTDETLKGKLMNIFHLHHDEAQ
ncbi:MAG TPA: hypothetical protein VN495_03385, partial [Candidatus Paceibacterota bacterium]|nr:hypothetical protein [Candidatus Paceibacterota bacterium]